MVLALAIAGATGRMGSLALAACAEATDLVCSAAMISPESPMLGLDAGEAIGLGKLGVPLSTHPGARFDVLLDFSLPAALPTWIQVCDAARAPIVVAATGHSEPELDALRALARGLPVLLAPNMALGANLLMRMVREAAALLGPGFEVGIHELHHKHKRDTPSGTALALAGATREASGSEPCISSQRLGNVAGEHTVSFSSGDETLSFVHRAESPVVFVAGALHAVRWIAQQSPGLYSMQDLLSSPGSA